MGNCLRRWARALGFKCRLHQATTYISTEKKDKKKKQDDTDSEAKTNFHGGNVHVISNKESWDEKISDANKAGKIVVANFSASWCDPCRQITPLYAELSEKYPQLVFLTIDVDEFTEFSSSWDIRATPTFFFLKNGQQLEHLVGANKPELEEKIIMFSESATPKCA